MSLDSSPEKTSLPRRIAVIGGGITGLAAAHRLTELARQAGAPVEIVLYEANSRLGGAFGTVERDGYLVETGADSFITNKPWGVDLCRRLGLEDRLIPTDPRYRGSLVLRKGKPVPVPEGFLLLAPARLGPVLRTPILSPWGKLRMGLERFIPARRDAGDESLGAFVTRRFGREALDRLVQPLLGGIYTSDPWKLSLEATMPKFLAMEREHGSLIRALSQQARESHNSDETQASGARYGLFVSLAGGMSELLEALEARLAGRATLKPGVEATRLAPLGIHVGASSRRWRLTLSDRSTDEADAVIVTLRAPHAARLVQPFDAPLAAMLGNIDYASSAIVVTGHRLSDIRHPLDAFGLVIPHTERRKILAVSFTSRKFPNRAPEGRVQLRTFVGGAMQPELLKQSDDRLIDLVRGELREIFGVEGTPELAMVCRYTNAMPQYHVGHVARVRQIEEQAGNHAGFTLAGNAYHGVGIPDCIHDAEQAAERVMADYSCRRSAP